MSGNADKGKNAYFQKLWYPAGEETGPVIALDMDPKKKFGMSSYYTGGCENPRRALANRTSARIEFYSIAAGKSSKFYPLDVAYAESFALEWNNESVYGRNDPLSTFSGTKRTIQLEFKVAAYSQEEAVANMIEISALTSMMYPTYKKKGSQSGGNASQLEAAPLMKVHFNNLIIDPSALGSASAGRNARASAVGLVCAFQSLNVTPDFENGVLQLGPSSGGPLRFFPQTPEPVIIQDNRIYPKSWTVSCALQIFHTFPLGFERKENGEHYSRGDTSDGFGAFPWGEKHTYTSEEQKKSSIPPDALAAAAKRATLASLSGQTPAERAKARPRELRAKREAQLQAEKAAAKAAAGKP